MNQALHDAARAACEEIGITYRTVPSDGRFHETDIEGDARGRGDGRIKIFSDGEGGIAFNWKGDKKVFFANENRSLSASERRERNYQRQEAIRAAEEAETLQHARAAEDAIKIIDASVPAQDDHPYLRRKRASPTATLREIDTGVAARIIGYTPKSKGIPLAGRLLVAPVTVASSISTLELIDEAGRKSALYGGQKAGGFWCSRRLPEGNGEGARLIIGEGVATVLSAYEATGDLCIAALSSSNLIPAAKLLRDRYPAAAIVFLADLVKSTGQPEPKALEAARFVSGRVAVPEFGLDRDPEMKDFNDMSLLRGQTAVKQAIEVAMVPACDDSQDCAPPEEAGKFGAAVNLVRATDLRPEPISWLWEGWLAAGKMHILGGAPGTGKTTISMSLAATVTTGGMWPDGTRSIEGNVVIWSGEDDPADTLIPRLVLSGADLSRVYFITEIREGNTRRNFDPARDMPCLREKLSEVGDVRLLIIDPIVSAITGDSHKNAEVRRGLQPLVELAAAMRCALLGITHFSKGTGGRDPVERLTGSLAFGALARVVIVAAKCQDEGEDGRSVRLLCRAKSNIGPDEGGFLYDLEQGELTAYPGIISSSVGWGEAVEGAARDLLSLADVSDDDGEGGKMADAKRFLADLLAEGPVPSKVIRADADAAGYAWATIRRAQNALGIEAIKIGKGSWVWQLPSAEVKTGFH